MKEQKKPNTKLRLNKTTITKLNDQQMNHLVGGANLATLPRPIDGFPGGEGGEHACTGKPKTITILTIGGGIE